MEVLRVMAYFHCRTRIQIRTRTWIPNPMAEVNGGSNILMLKIEVPCSIRLARLVG